MRTIATFGVLLALAPASAWAHCHNLNAPQGQGCFKPVKEFVDAWNAGDTSKLKEQWSKANDADLMDGYGTLAVGKAAIGAVFATPTYGPLINSYKYAFGKATGRDLLAANGSVLPNLAIVEWEGTIGGGYKHHVTALVVDDANNPAKPDYKFLSVRVASIP